eukprot:2274813-Prymnesium_polylepis.3
MPLLLSASQVLTGGSAAWAFARLYHRLFAALLVHVVCWPLDERERAIWKTPCQLHDRPAHLRLMVLAKTYATQAFEACHAAGARCEPLRGCTIPRCAHTVQGCRYCYSRQLFREDARARRRASLCGGVADALRVRRNRTLGLSTLLINPSTPASALTHQPIDPSIVQNRCPSPLPSPCHFMREIETHRHRLAATASRQRTRAPTPAACAETRDRDAIERWRWRKRSRRMEDSPHPQG